MSVIIRLQGLPDSAKAEDVRTFFAGLRIPDGAVHIVGGDEGDAFIGFATDEDARQAMRLTNRRIHSNEVRLLLSSRSEMNTVIAETRQKMLAAVASATRGNAADGERAKTETVKPAHAAASSSAFFFRRVPTESDSSSAHDPSYHRPDFHHALPDQPPHRGGPHPSGSPSGPQSLMSLPTRDSPHPPQPMRHDPYPRPPFPPRNGDSRERFNEFTSFASSRDGPESGRRLSGHDRERQQGRDESWKNCGFSQSAYSSSRGHGSFKRPDSPTRGRHRSEREENSDNRDGDGFRHREEGVADARSSQQSHQPPPFSMPAGEKTRGYEHGEGREWPGGEGGTLSPRRLPGAPLPTLQPSPLLFKQAPQIQKESQSSSRLPSTSSASQNGRKEEEAYVELSRLPPELLRPAALESFLSPSTPLTLSSLKVVFGPQGIHLYSLVRFSNAMDAFNALKKNGEQGIRINPSSKEFFETAQDGPPVPVQMITPANLGSMELPQAADFRIPPQKEPQMAPSRSSPPSSRRSRSPLGRRRETRRGYRRSRSPEKDSVRMGERSRSRSRSRDRFRSGRGVRRGGRRRPSVSPIRLSGRFCVEILNAPYMATEDDIRQFLGGRLHPRLLQKVHDELGRPSDRWIVEFTLEEDAERAFHIKSQIRDRPVRIRRVSCEEADRLLSVKEKSHAFPSSSSSGPHSSSFTPIPPPPPEAFGAFSTPVYSSSRARGGLPQRGRGGLLPPPMPLPPLPPFMPGMPFPIPFPPMGPRGSTFHGLRGRGRGRGFGPGPQMFSMRPPMSVTPHEASSSTESREGKGPVVLMLTDLPEGASQAEVAEWLKMPVQMVHWLAEQNAAYVEMEAEEARRAASVERPPLRGEKQRHPQRPTLSVLPKERLDIDTQLRLLNSPSLSTDNSRTHDIESADCQVARQIGPKGTVLSCSGFPANLSLEELLSFFSGYSVIESSVRMRMGEDNEPTGECMLGMESTEDARRAVASLHGQSLRGSRIDIHAI